MAGCAAFIEAGYCYVWPVLCSESLERFFNALLYLSDSKMWPMQVLLRQMILLASGSLDMSTMDLTYVKPPDQSIKMAVVVVGTLPILLVYPFIQKHFAKGVLLGAVKG